MKCANSGGLTTEHHKKQTEDMAILINHQVPQGELASALGITPEQSTPKVNTGKAKKSKKGSSSGKNSH